MTTRRPLVLPLLLLALLGASPTTAASGAVSGAVSDAVSGDEAEATHDSFTTTLRLARHGRCTLAKSDAAVRAHLACRDGHGARVRYCPQRDSRRCFWHAPTRGSGEGRSFLRWAGRTTYLRL